ncbi:Nramp family mn2+ fe2+ transporter, putative [Ichthyophthirius multifiliis]|uniref:Nramp family mn2+ fe2+ transporter, putative n=1 Tax=Ichthyophthirius multifiliis TaxID=5932 RepID=G0R659_ICHMU|nr:Nramp family mn2+ fe2+ transporter, putative [Ichthyophthirius multifiliis]EGR27023.1 Nramp family mn2+ fe2+ transporter, putative [Ichthyophthirius multifiliis]|eukprot:XP_004023907.1 Nramp family mn2+ fe2+ transporter, putative [Ichthyophthirius multifiliis]
MDQNKNVQQWIQMEKNADSIDIKSQEYQLEISEKQTQITSLTGSEEQQPFRFSFRELLSYLGPGLLVSVAYLDPGNLSGNIDAGVSSRYSLIWVLLLATILGYLFQIRSMMIGLATKKDMAKLCRIYYPPKISKFLWAMFEIAIIGADIQEVLGSAFALNILFGIKVWVGVLLTIFAAFLILLFAKKLEILFGIMISIMAISFFVEFMVVKPNYLELLQGIFIPSIPYESSFDPLVGLIGAVLMPHNLFLHSSLVMDKKIEKKKLKSLFSIQRQKQVLHLLQLSLFRLLLLELLLFGKDRKMAVEWT